MAEGGFLVALAECCLAGNIGARLEFPDAGASPRLEYLFGEAVGGFIVSGPREAIDRLAAQVPTDILGPVGGDELELRLADRPVRVALADLRAAHRSLGPAFA
jgi:phosphoribosylformylglycinamidine synthase